MLFYSITMHLGLDPAMPLFVTASVNDKLDPSDAVYVDVIHTNAMVQGKLERCGHADFYMNGGIIQPGCSRNNPLSESICTFKIVFSDNKVIIFLQIHLPAVIKEQQPIT